MWFKIIGVVSAVASVYAVVKSHQSDKKTKTTQSEVESIKIKFLDKQKATDMESLRNKAKQLQHILAKYTIKGSESLVGVDFEKDAKDIREFIILYNDVKNVLAVELNDLYVKNNWNKFNDSLDQFVECNSVEEKKEKGKKISGLVDELISKLNNVIERKSFESI